MPVLHDSDDASTKPACSCPPPTQLCETPAPDRSLRGRVPARRRSAAGPRSDPGVRSRVTLRLMGRNDLSVLAARPRARTAAPSAGRGTGRRGQAVYFLFFNMPIMELFLSIQD